MKKLLCMILAVMTLTSLLCTQAFAANNDPYADLGYGEAGIEKLKKADEHAFITGSRGSAESTGIIGSVTNDTSGCYGTIKDHSDCITWSLKDGVLILTGEGYTVSGNQYSGQGPFHNNPYIETIIIDSNIKSAHSLITGMPNLKTVIVMSNTDIDGISDCYKLDNIIIGANLTTDTAETPIPYTTTTRTMNETSIILANEVTTVIFKAEDVKNIYSADENPEFIGVKQRKETAATAWASYNGYRTMDELVSMAKSAIADANLPNYALAMISTELGGTAGAYDPIEGIAVSTWAKDSVRDAFRLGLVPTYAIPDNYQQAITRAEFCTLANTLYRSVTHDNYIPGSTPFTDCYDNDVRKMASLGVVGGYGNGIFGPDDLITREQAAVMLSRLAEVITGKTMTEGNPTFTDNIANWAKAGVNKVYSAGIMGGYNATIFGAKDNYSIEQSIVTMLRVMEYVNK